MGHQPMSNKQRITFDLPVGVYTKLKKLAEKEKRSVSAQIHLFLEQAVVRHHTEGAK